jgi:codanin-1
MFARGFRHVLPQLRPRGDRKVSCDVLVRTRDPTHFSGLTSDKKSDVDGSKSSSEINRSHSFPLDLSSELDDSIKSSTPKMTKVSSDSSVQSYMSPVSPIYKTHASFTTPKCHKSLCLGDFIVTRRASSKKKSQNSETKRRIKPTNLTQKVNGFHKSENSFNFNRSEPDELPNERNVLAEERLKILSRSSIQSGGSPKKISRGFPEEVSPDRGAVNHAERIDKLVRVYVHLLDNHFVSNLTSEVYFLITLLLRKQFYSLDWGIAILNDKWTSILFNSIHNVVYFAAKALESQIRILRNYDNSTVRLLVENRRLAQFSPVLVENLQNISKPDRIIEVDTFRDNICFNSDTDNRQNFPNDPSFHAFRKQRDLFYEILRLWERHHMSPGFSYSVSLAGKIKSLLSLSTEPTNFIHFARLFKAQLLSTCQNGDCDDFVTSLDVDAQKLSKLKSRCVTKGNCQGLNSLPKFTENEEFYRDFILVGANHCFNRHLADALIDEIVELNETSFSNELDTRGETTSCVT